MIILIMFGCKLNHLSSSTHSPTPEADFDATVDIEGLVDLRP